MNIKINKSLITSIALFLSTSATAQVIEVSDLLGAATEQNNVFTLNSNNGLLDTEIENSLALITGSLDALSTGDATIGSAISGNVNVLSGDTFSFDFIFSSDEIIGTTFNDFSFLSLTLNDTDIFNGLQLLADSSAQSGNLSNFSTTFSSSGVLNFGIGILDVNDEAVNSSLTISELQILQVPEPSTIAIFTLSLMGLISRRFIKK